MKVVLGLGSNLGSREVLLRAAVDLIGDVEGVRVEGISPVYETAPQGGPPQPQYLNAAVRVTTSLAPEALLDAVLGIERTLGRDRSTEPRHGPRTCDIDLLHADVPVPPSDRLTLPHPRLNERAFALGPLLDVAPELAPLYAATLQALGGRPARGQPLGHALAVGVDGARVSASGRDLADAVAACISLVPAALGDVPHRTRGHTHDLALSIEPDDVLAVLAEVALTARLGGFDLRHALILRLEGTTLVVRFLGGRGGDPVTRAARVGSVRLGMASGVPTATLTLVSNQAGTP